MGKFRPFRPNQYVFIHGVFLTGISKRSLKVSVYIVNQTKIVLSVRIALITFWVLPAKNNALYKF